MFTQLRIDRASDDDAPIGTIARLSGPRSRRMPRAMRTAPRLDPHRATPSPTPFLALLINPFYPKDPHASLGKHVLTPSLALTSIAGATPPNWTVRYWDENLLQGPPPFDPFPSVVGITVHLTFAKRAYELAHWYRSRGARVIMGGLHVLSCPDEVQPFADAIVLGEGVQLWPRILADVEHRCLNSVYHGSFSRPPYPDNPPPRRAILPRRSFLTTSSIIATRGCHNRCGFCYLATDGLSMPYQVRDPAQIVSEMVENDEPYAVFVDNNLGSRPEYLRRLCTALAGADRIWSAAVSIDVTDDPDLVRRMALAGCTGVFVGFESLTARNLDQAGKKTPRPEEYARRVRLLHDAGIQVNASFVFGFDDDHPDVFDRTVQWVEDNHVECATYHILTPYPGTPLFRKLESQGRILHRDWTLYDTAHVVFTPRNMTPRQLFEGYTRCYRRTFSWVSIWKRRPQTSRQVLSYLAMSLLYKRANWLWPWLIRARLTHLVWRPLVEMSRIGHVRWRRRFLQAQNVPAVPAPVYPGV